LTYFKTHGGTYGKGGKYYAEGKYDSELVHMDDIWDEVIQLREKGELPGLARGAKEFHILIEVPKHPHNHPRLIVV
jgi:hypothetical protein